MKPMILFLSLLCAASTWAVVKQEALNAQIAVVQAAQTKLDSLYSLQLAEDWQSIIAADSLLSANGTKALVAEKIAGNFDPRFVAVDVNFAGWSASAKTLWGLGIQVYGKHVVTEVAGRYNVRQDNVQGLLGYLKTFLGQF